MASRLVSYGLQTEPTTKLHIKPEPDMTDEPNHFRIT